jgi:Arylsulfotransferase (ASST)
MAAALAGGGYGFLRTLAAAAAETTGSVHVFHSRRDLRPPAVTIARRAGAVSPGLLFLAPSSGPGQRGVLLVDDMGEPVYFHPTTPGTAMNFRAGTYRGEPVLTWWEGKTEHGLGEGTHVILDSSYRVVDRVAAGNGLPSDLHEWQLTSHGTALATAWELETADLRSVGGPARGKVIGGVAQELELPSGRVLFEWRSLDHVALNESHAGVAPHFDYFHINAIDVDADGNLLVSARNTWAVYKVERASGAVRWRLGGRKSDFAMGPGTQFAWQHDARHHYADDRWISIFDDGAAPPVHKQSRGIVLAVDEARRRATLERAFVHDPPVLAHALGSVQLLPNGNVLVGWGTAPWFTEYAADGEVLLDAQLPAGGENYRTLRFPWVGRPSLPPELAAAGGALWASWNGSTETAAWQLHAGARESALGIASTTPRRGFETQLALPPGTRYAAVVALGAKGKPLGRSKTISVV